MAILDWFVRCLPGLSTLCLLVLAECALHVVQTAVIGLTHPPGLHISPSPVFAQFLFCSYSLLLHLLAILFPLRLCRAVWQATDAIQAVRQICRDSGLPPKEKLEDAPGSPSSLSTSPQQDEQDTPSETIQAIMVPSYKEDIGVLEDTLNVLASHPMAFRSYDVCIGSQLSCEPSY